MRILVDTHVLIWSQMQVGSLSERARALLEDVENDVLFSAASIWEIAIKTQLKRIEFLVAPERIAAAAVAGGFVELAVRANAAARVARLPLYHRDPFDRLLMAQAIEEPAHLLTADSMLAQYSDLVTLIEP